MTNLKLSDIFQIKAGIDSCSKSELSKLKLKEDFIDKVSQQLDLSYGTNEDDGGSVCYLNAPGIQPLYKLVFNESDIVDYICRALKTERFSVKRDKVPFPKELFTRQGR